MGEPSPSPNRDQDAAEHRASARRDSRSYSRTRHHINRRKYIAITAMTTNRNTVPAITAQLDQLRGRRGGGDGGNGNAGAMMVPPFSVTVASTVPWYES
jgi:hypothetical protein